MAPKKNAAAGANSQSTSSSTPATNTPVSNKPSSTSTASRNASTNPQDIATGIWENYVNNTPQRVKLIDTFMLFLVIVGGLQFLYCILAGNYPFNAFLSGFSATVGQFVLTASLRIQTNSANAADFKQLSHERAFADFVFGSMILHFFCVNFIN
ncbi:DAD family protein [Acrodontium crateriforme]|uniref:Dolichyl-diphosphooligosaccharide--protein glycosyltransferase subunit OST2 n=1 Tax=Acrodontium crateriforme TaxID=150365 RepID=A0AAQ3M9H5_9PEZI|nr:DAD family protein [Acrodontium crateriforme]